MILGGYELIRARSGNQYVMVAYHCDSNSILACPFKTRQDVRRLAAYNSIKTRLKAKGHEVDLQILDNEDSAAYKKLITEEWGAKFQLVPPNMHRRNAAERAIRTFKAHFLAILAIVAPDFPRYLWDLLVPQVEMTLNFLCQAIPWIQWCQQRSTWTWRGRSITKRRPSFPWVPG